MIALVPAAVWLAAFSSALNLSDDKPPQNPVGRAVYELEQQGKVSQDRALTLPADITYYNEHYGKLLGQSNVDPQTLAAGLNDVKTHFQGKDLGLIATAASSSFGYQVSVERQLSSVEPSGPGDGASVQSGLGNRGSSSSPGITQPTPGNAPIPMTSQVSQKIGFDKGEAQFNPNNPAPRLDLARLYLATGNDGQSVANTAAAIQLGDHSPSTLVLYAKGTALLGDTEQANRAARLALEEDPNNRQALQLEQITRNRASTVRLGDALAAAGLAPAAMDGASPGGASQPTASVPDAAAAQGALSAGAAAGSSAGAVYAGDAGASGVTAAELAAQAARQARVSPSNVSQSLAFTREAESRLDLQDYNGALQVAKTATDLNPANAQAWNYRAVAETHLGQYAPAVEDATYSLNVVPNMPARLTRSWAFSKQQQYKEALADASDVIEKDPSNAFAYKMAAFAQAGMGDRSAALASLKRAADLNPGFQPMYQAAVNAPKDSDLLFLFDGAAPSGPAAPAAPGSRKRRFLSFILLSLSGGLIMALGILHIVSASWREKVNATVRRVLGKTREVGAGASAEASQPAAGAGFWGQYELLSTLGTGGMGVVYEARDLSLDRKVAIKKMRDEIRADPAERRRFVTEARTVAGLHHPNIVDIFSIVEDGGDVYLVFEHVAGKTLSQKLVDGPLPFDEARTVLRGVCEAVDYAHSRGVIHRDLKPSNVMLTEAGEAKVMDFGVARQAKDAVTKIMTNTVVGTPPYMAPEQEQGTVRKESDVFALGVCFYEMLTGELPFAGSGAGMLLNKLNGRLTPISARLGARTPAGLDAVLAKALAAAPEQRYQSAAQFSAAVEALSAAGAARS